VLLKGLWCYLFFQLTLSIFMFLMMVPLMKIPIKVHIAAQIQEYILRFC
jgi:hypothetical protein